jgi:hypothetical protein
MWEYLSTRSGDNARLLLCSEHRIRLPGTRGSIGQDRPIVALEYVLNGLQAHGVVDILLRLRGSKHSVECECHPLRWDQHLWVINYLQGLLHLQFICRTYANEYSDVALQGLLLLVLYGALIHGRRSWALILLRLRALRYCDLIGSHHIRHALHPRINALLSSLHWSAVVLIQSGFFFGIIEGFAILPRWLQRDLSQLSGVSHIHVYYVDVLLERHNYDATWDFNC